MKAAIRTGVTGFTLSFTSDHPVPAWDAEKNNANDVYLKVHGAAMNPVDVRILEHSIGKIASFLHLFFAAVYHCRTL
jgi:hypothetical protein